jgi:hypothetical protein
VFWFEKIGRKSGTEYSTDKINPFFNLPVVLIMDNITLWFGSVKIHPWERFC